MVRLDLLNDLLDGYCPMHFEAHFFNFHQIECLRFIPNIPLRHAVMVNGRPDAKRNIFFWHHMSRKLSFCPYLTGSRILYSICEIFYVLNA